MCGHREMVSDDSVLNQNFHMPRLLSKSKQEVRHESEDEDDSGDWLRTTPWPASLLKLYPQIPDAVVSKNLSVFSHFHSTFAGDLLYSKIRNVKELIQYNRLKQDCIKNLWNQTQPFHELLTLKYEEVEPAKPAKSKTSNNDEIVRKKKKNIDDKLNTINEICDSFNAIISQKNGPIIKGEIDNEKLQVKIELLDRRKTLYDFQKEFEKAFDSLPPTLINSKEDTQIQSSNQSKKLKTEKIENSYARKNFNIKNKTNQTDISKKSCKFSEKSSSLIKENFGSFPINQGEIIETLEEVCQWLHNVYPHKSKYEHSKLSEDINNWSEKEVRESAHTSTELVTVTKKNGSNNQVKKILPRPNNVSDFSCQMFSQIPSRRLYRDVLTNAEVQLGIEPDPVNKFAELEREAIEQYSGCSINSETSIALLPIDEDSKFKDLEREAIEQYQPEEDSIITSGELFTTSELMKQSQLATPPKVNSSIQVNIFETENKKETNCLNCQALRKSSSEYLLCSDTWPDGIETLLTENNTQTDSIIKRPVKNELNAFISTPVRILKSARNKELPLDVDFDHGPAFKNLTYTSPYDSPSEDFVPEECCSKMVKFILNKNREHEQSEEEINKDSETIAECSISKFRDDKILESCSKTKESDEERSGLDDSKKKKKKKKRSRKKKCCKKDGGGGGGGGNGRGGGGRCDARTPIHCPIPLTSKSSESKIKKKEDSCKKDKRGETTLHPIPYKWQRLNCLMIRAAKVDNPIKITLEDFLYNEYCLEQLSMDKITNICIPHSFFMSIPSYLFISKSEHKVSVLTDLIYYRLQKWGWCYITQRELFAKSVSSYYQNKAELFPSWLKWCDCFNLRVGHSHTISPGSVLAPDVRRVPKQDIFNPKYWELSGGGVLQGIIVDLDKFTSLESMIESLINTSYYNQFRSPGIRSFNQYKYMYEFCSQKIYHICNNYGSMLTSEVLNLQKKTNTRKFHRGKNNKIKGKTFCYYCSGNSFKNYTLHTFFCEVDAQNKGVVMDREKSLIPPVKKAWATTSTSSKYQQTEKDITNFQEDIVNAISWSNVALDESSRCLNSSCYKCRSPFINSDALRRTNVGVGVQTGTPTPAAAVQTGTQKPAGVQTGTPKPVGVQTSTPKPVGVQTSTPKPVGGQPGSPTPVGVQVPVVSAKNVKNHSKDCCESNSSLLSSQSVQIINHPEDQVEETKSHKKSIPSQSDKSKFFSSYNIKLEGESSKPLIDFLKSRKAKKNEFTSDEISKVTFEEYTFSRFEEVIKEEEEEFWALEAINRQALEHIDLAALRECTVNLLSSDQRQNTRDLIIKEEDSSNSGELLN